MERESYPGSVWTERKAKVSAHVLLGTRGSAWDRAFNKYPSCEKTFSFSLSFHRNRDPEKNPVIPSLAHEIACAVKVTISPVERAVVPSYI